jgi:hypothetical protein
MLSRGEKMETQCLFFHIKKLPKVLRYQLNILKSTLDRGLACAKRIPTHETLDYQYEWQKLLQEKGRIYAYGTA